MVRRYDGRHFRRYSREHGHAHTFLLKDVPGFTYIMVHIGNEAVDTHRYPLTGYGHQRKPNGDYRVLQSKDAYCDAFYPLFTELTAGGDRCFLNVVRVP